TLRGSSHREGAQRTTHAGTAEPVANRHEGALAHHACGQAGPLLILAPRLLLGNEARGEAATADHEVSQQQHREANAQAKHGNWRMPATLLRLREPPPRLHTRALRPFCEALVGRGNP